MSTAALQEKLERTYVIDTLARKFYEAQCKHKGWEPRERIDSWAYEYAEMAVDYLGFDRDALLLLSGDAA